MRIALLQVSHDKDANWHAPLGLRYLEAVARPYADVTVFDGNPSPVTLAKYDLVGIYALSQDWDDALALALHAYLPAGVEATVEAWLVNRWWHESARPMPDGYYTYAPS